jgi:hypothetical protein
MKKIRIRDAFPPEQRHLATVFRCYPRTLKEAFPQDRSDSYPFIYPMHRNSGLVLRFVVVIVAVVVLGLDLFVWRP